MIASREVIFFVLRKAFFGKIFVFEGFLITDLCVFGIDASGANYFLNGSACNRMLSEGIIRHCLNNFKFRTE